MEGCVKGLQAELAALAVSLVMAPGALGLDGDSEALLGQLYLVTVVAVIISNLRPARPRSRREDKPA
jgi:hypothetical protein